jgi:hypothetical protein
LFVIWLLKVIAEMLIGILRVQQVVANCQQLADQERETDKG